MPDAPPVSGQSPLMRIGTAALGVAALVYAVIAANNGRVDFGALYGGSSIGVEGFLAYVAAVGAGLFGGGAVVLSIKGTATPRSVALGTLAGGLVYAVLWLLALIDTLLGLSLLS